MYFYMTAIKTMRQLSFSQWIYSLSLAVYLVFLHHSSKDNETADLLTQSCCLSVIMSVCLPPGLFACLPSLCVSFTCCCVAGGWMKERTTARLSGRSRCRMNTWTTFFPREMWVSICRVQANSLNLLLSSATWRHCRPFYLLWIYIHTPLSEDNTVLCSYNQQRNLLIDYF